jgi:hypothetical protein
VWGLTDVDGMATTPLHLNPRGPRIRALLVLLPLAAAVAGCGGNGGSTGAHGDGEGRTERIRPSGRPTVEASFPQESYAAGAAARLVISDRANGVAVQLFRAGTEGSRINARDVMLGTAMTPPQPVGRVAGRRVVTLRIGEWPSGLYFARLTAPGGRVGYVPFVLRPRRLGESRIAVVMPTFTWQAYNFRDDDGDGDADTWYDGADERFARLYRPYENRGVPPHYKHYDQPFVRWLSSTGKQFDMLADTDLHRTTGRALASAYELIVFPGHHEYVTAREYAAVRGFRDRGGNLVFLSANNFFWRVDLRSGAIWRIAKWRDLGRPEAALIGVQYIKNDMGESRGAWIVTRAGARSWIFDGVGARPGAGFSNGGIEIDKTAPSSPRGTTILAEIPNLMGPGMSGQMTYYETPQGAKVFAAGAFTLAGAIRQPTVWALVENLWYRLGETDDPGGRP